MHAAPAAKDTLSKAIRMIQRGENDSLRFTANTFLKDSLYKVLIADSTFSAPFNQFNNVSIVVDEMKSVRIFTWIVPHFSGEKYSFFGFLQMKDLKKGTVQTWSLNDKTDSIQKPESAKLTEDSWFGSVYYSIIPKEINGKYYYTLLGWKGKSNAITQKTMDVLFFEKGKPQFGKPIFKSGSVYKNRMIYSFTSQATMTLKYEENKKRIVVDHIAGNGNSENMAFLNGPDGSYDAFEFKKGKWIMQDDVDVDAGRKKPAKIEPVKDEELFKK